MSGIVTDLTEEEIAEALERKNLWLVELHGDNIRSIDNPSEAVQMAAVSGEGSAIRHINCPSEAVQHAALTKDCYSLRFIQKPSEEMLLYATSIDGRVIEHIVDPSEAVQLSAVNQYGLAISYIQMPTEAVQLKSVEQDGYILCAIPNFTVAVMAAAVRTSPGIVFDTRAKDKLPTARLDQIYPGIAAQVELIRTLDSDDQVRASLFAAWYATLPLDNHGVQTDPEWSSLPSVLVP